MPFLLEHKCGASRITEAGWFQGQIKAMACVDKSHNMVEALGEVYPGAKIEALKWEDLPSFPRVRIWLTANDIDDLTTGLEGVGVKSDADTDVTVVDKRP